MNESNHNTEIRASIESNRTHVVHPRTVMLSVAFRGLKKSQKKVRPAYCDGQSMFQKKQKQRTSILIIHLWQIEQ